MFKNFTWGHGIVLALGSFMIFILSMIFIFSRGMQNSELITDNYYEEELQYQKVIDAKNNADALPEKPVYSQNANGITIKFPAEINNGNAKFKIDLHRAEDRNLDVIREIPLNRDNAVFLPAAILAEGNYVLRVMWTKDQQDYQMDYNIVW